MQERKISRLMNRSRALTLISSGNGISKHAKRSPLRHTSSFTVVPYRCRQPPLSPFARSTPLTWHCIFYYPLPDYDDCVNIAFYAQSGISNFPCASYTLRVYIFFNIRCDSCNIFLRFTFSINILMLIKMALCLDTNI